MPDYVALLGRINVGGNTVTMVDLRAIVAELGHTRVGSYIQTGNVFFTTPSTDTSALELELGNHLSERLGFTVPTFLRTSEQLAATLAGDPFDGVTRTEDIRLMVIAMNGALPPDLEFPVHDQAKGFTLLGARGGDALVVLRLVNGRPGNVVAWLEKRYGVSGTGRFAHTLAKILTAAGNPRQPPGRPGNSPAVPVPG